MLKYYKFQILTYIIITFIYFNVEIFSININNINPIIISNEFDFGRTTSSTFIFTLLISFRLQNWHQKFLNYNCLKFKYNLHQHQWQYQLNKVPINIILEIYIKITFDSFHFENYLEILLKSLVILILTFVPIISTK